MSNIAWFGVLYGTSFLPWLGALKIKNKDSQWGLFLIDGSLTIAGTIFFWWALGWWVVLFVIASIGCGLLLRGLGIYAYTTLGEDLLQRKEARKKESVRHVTKV